MKTFFVNCNVIDRNNYLISAYSDVNKYAILFINTLKKLQLLNDNYLINKLSYHYICFYFLSKESFEYSNITYKDSNKFLSDLAELETLIKNNKLSTYLMNFFEKNVHLYKIHFVKDVISSDINMKNKFEYIEKANDFDIL